MRRPSRGNHWIRYGLAALGFCLSLSSASQAQLIISEIVDATLPGGLPKFVELTNTGCEAIDLSGYSIGNINNGAATLGFDALVLSGIVAAGDSYIVSFEDGDTPGSSIFFDVYGFDADNMDEGAFTNGDDVVVLFQGAALAGDPADGSGTPVADKYGVVGVDGTGEVWEYTDGYSYRNPSVTTGSVTFVPAEWTFGGANSLEDPGGDDVIELALIQANTNPGVHTFDPPTCLSGELIISEIVDATLPGGLPKFVELTNTGCADVDLSEYSIGNINNGAATMGNDALVLSGTLAPGDSYITSWENSDTPGSSIFFDTYGFDADNLDQGAFTNGDDVIVLFHGAGLAGDPADGSVVPVADKYGVVGVDGTGEVWEYTDGYSYRNPSAIVGNVTFTPAEWTFGGANSLEDPGGDDAIELALILANTNPGVHTFDSPCGGATGGCCDDATGMCSIETAVDCATAGNRYGGDGSNCMTIDPPCLARGACCDDATGTCTIETEADCTGAGNRYGGDGSDCNTIDPPCEVPTGACCYAGFCAGDVNEMDCINGGGTYQGDNSDCGSVSCPAGPSVVINEIRTDQPGGDNDEYFELYGDPGASLDGLTYLVIGDGSGGSGVIEAVVPLTGSAMPGDGFFVAAESTFTLATADLTTSLNFENSDNVTHLLVAGFSGVNGDDLDTDDNGTLDATPWAGELDRIALILENNPPATTEYHYGPPTVGPDGSFVPGQVFRCPDGTGGWNIGSFDPAGGDDTPGDPNGCETGACCRSGVCTVEAPDTCDGTYNGADSTCEGDVDGDGVDANCGDTCPADPFKTDAGVCGCGQPDTDSDGDGTANCIDGCPDDPDKTEAGICGCGVSDTDDSDGDGVTDCIDQCPGINDMYAPECIGAIPTVSEWGLVVLALALLTGVKLLSRVRREPA